MVAAGTVFSDINRHCQVAACLSDRAVALIVKRHAAAGLDPTHYAGHSLRAGFATDVAARGIAEREIAR